MRHSYSPKAFIIGALAVAGTSLAQGEDITAIIAQANGNLDTLDITKGTSTLIGNNDAGVYSGLAFGANESVLYGIVSAAVGDPTTLVSINKTTGADTTIGSTGSEAISAITNTGDGTLYGVGYDDSLYKISSTTGTASLIGKTGLPTLNPNASFANSLSSDGTKLYYTLQISGIPPPSTPSTRQPGRPRKSARPEPTVSPAAPSPARTSRLETFTALPRAATRTRSISRPARRHSLIAPDCPASSAASASWWTPPSPSPRPSLPLSRCFSSAERSCSCGTASVAIPPRPRLRPAGKKSE